MKEMSGTGFPLTGGFVTTVYPLPDALRFLPDRGDDRFPRTARIGNFVQAIEQPGL
jgi:hypothetical protein